MNHFYASRRTFSFLTFLLGIFSTSLAATFTVTTTADSGPGSLRQAILDANGTAGADIIVFNIAGAGPHVIAPIFPGLPAITEAVTIDGYTQPGASAAPIATRIITIVLNGAAAGFNSGLILGADNIAVSGLCINGFGLNGIDVTDGFGNIHIWGNFIGTDPTGFVDLGNSFSGISLGTDLGGGGNFSVVVGTNSDGTGDTDEGNLISGNGLDGITGWTLSNCIFSGNFIGSDRAGVGNIGNTRNGILLTVGSSDNRIGTNGDGVNDVQELNGLIFNGTGIAIAAGSTFNIIAGNIVGINTLGAAAGNTGNGIEIINSSSNRIGVDVSHAGFVAESNIISSNGGSGILLSALDFFGNTDPVSDNIIAGNFIGTTPTNDVRGNGGNGINITSANSVANAGNRIGSNNDDVSDDEEANVITNNAVFGIVTSNAVEVFGNMISRNAIHSNSSLGIDLGGDGVTANDNGDGDTGPNELFNFPVILNSMNDGAHLWVAGITGASTIVEVYLSDGSGEGATFLFRAQEGATLNGIADNLSGTDSYSDPVYGNFTDQEFRFVVALSDLPVVIPPGAMLVAIGIDPTPGNPNTSEFGPAMVTLPVTLTGFKAQLVDGIVKLNWSTSREINSSHFVIEKSLDGVSYSAIGQVSSGTSSGQYSFTDRTTLGKINYYRLKLTDLDQHFTYSKVLIVRNDSEPVVFKLSPNPVSTYLNVSFKLEKDEVIKLTFYDQMGRLAKRYTLQGSRGINAFTISDLGNLASGNYVVEILGESISVKQQIMKR